MSNFREYIVTLKDRDDLDDFYEDMETLRKTKYDCMPERAVECCCRRPNSRNTHYDLTEEEAEVLKNDPRVLAIELTPEEQGLVIHSLFTQTESTWNKSSTQTGTHKNWGLLRSVEGAQRSDWGSNGTANQSGTIQVNAEGKNVDVVVVDGMIDPTHPELAVNSDGTGGSRVVQFNWFSLNPAVTGGTAGTYVYTPYTGSGAESDNNHGAHIAGTVAGNTQGWARKANIYNINPYSTDVNSVSGTLLIDYIREFHKNKFVGRTHTITNSGASSYIVDGSGTNPAISLRRGLTYTLNINSSGHPFWIKTAQVTGTGSAYNTGVTNNGVDTGTITFRVPLDAPDTLYYICQFHGSMTGVFNITGTGKENPTICNHSWGYSYSPVAISSITSVVFQGTTINGPFTAGELNGYGIFTATVDGTPSAIAPARVTAVDADMVDAIADGIIMVGAAGNDFTKIDVVGGTDYNNRFVSTFNYRYHEGSSPTAAAGCICVGAINSLVNEAKATFSNCGPRVDIYAPGVNIMSSLNIINSDWPGADDPRNATYKIGKAQGTSMASPQVCGVLACVLEVYPNLTPAKALEYITTYSKKNQITNTGGSYTDYTSLQGSENRYLFYYKERKDSGSVFPKTNYLLRSSSKQAYPRPRIRRTA